MIDSARRLNRTRMVLEVETVMIRDATINYTASTAMQGRLSSWIPQALSRPEWNLHFPAGDTREKCRSDVVITIVKKHRLLMFRETHSFIPSSRDFQFFTCIDHDIFQRFDCFVSFLSSIQILNNEKLTSAKYDCFVITDPRGERTNVIRPIITKQL